MKPLALLSVTDKSGIVEFANELIAQGFEILSTGNTARHLQESDVDVMGVSYYTSMPEILGGRVKTLHPKVHGGLLAKPDDEVHLEEMEELNIRRIHVLAVNLYPFEKTVLGGAPFEEAIENIDIGGPAMIRAAAKNAENVIVVVDPSDYDIAAKLLVEDDKLIRRRLQAKAFAHTAFYDSLIAQYLSSEALGETLTLGLRLHQELRYGENPHQRAAIYHNPFQTNGSSRSKQIWGRELSYNNHLDADAAWELACDLKRTMGVSSEPCVIVKHGNPCGAAWCAQQEDSFAAAKLADPVSAFGGIVAFPGRLTDSTCERLIEKGSFFEVVVCADISEAAVEMFREKSGWAQNLRILVAPLSPDEGFLCVRSIRGGALVQEADTADPVTWRTVTNAAPTGDQETALRAAWVCAKHVKSNAICICGPESLLGVGAGQMNRVQSVRLAAEQAGAAARGAVLASDAFFPFPDSIEEAARRGIAAIVQPGGSKRDDEVVEAANRLGLAMVFTGVRHFRH